MPNTEPVADEGSAIRFLRRARRGARAPCACYPIGAITVGQEGEALAEIGDMVAEGAVALLRRRPRRRRTPGMMRLAMDYTKRFDVPIVCALRGRVARRQAAS